MALFVLASSSTDAQNERAYQQALCSGWTIEQSLSDTTRVDCISSTHAKEVDFSDKWAEGIGQALYYSTQTGLEPGLILVCRRQPDTCQGHLDRALAVVGEYGLPLTVWICEPEARALAECKLSEPTPIS